MSDRKIGYFLAVGLLILQIFAILLIFLTSQAEFVVRFEKVQFFFNVLEESEPKLKEIKVCWLKMEGTEFVVPTAVVSAANIKISPTTGEFSWFGEAENVEINLLPKEKFSCQENESSFFKYLNFSWFDSQRIKIQEGLRLWPPGIRLAAFYLILI